MTNGDTKQGDKKECCQDKSKLTLRRIVQKQHDWLAAGGRKVAEVIAEIQGPNDGDKCCPDGKGIKPAIVFILKLDSFGNEATCGFLKKFDGTPPGFGIDTDGQPMTVTFTGECDPAKKIDGLVTAYIRIPIECPPDSKPACSCTFDDKKRVTTVTYNSGARFRVEWHAEVVRKDGQDCVIKEVKGEVDKFIPVG